MPDPSATNSASKTGAKATSTAAKAGPVEPTAAESPAAPETAPDQPATATGEGPVTSTAKEIFAAALEKKKSAGQSRSAHLDGHGGVGGATASHKATRTFRRKSG